MARLALDKQAKKIIILDIKKLSSVSDYLLICSADSDRQVQAIADNIEEGLGKKKEKPLGIEGKSEGRWALLDFNDVVAHIFHEPVRDFYDLEGLWAEATGIEVQEEPERKAVSEKAKAKSRKKE